MDWVYLRQDLKISLVDQKIKALICLHLGILSIQGDAGLTWVFFELLWQPDFTFSSLTVPNKKEQEN